jgi:hypothetical protein
MATVIVDEQWVCVDCLMVIANDDATGIEDDDRAEAVRRAVYGTEGYWVADSTEETDLEFSWSPCDCCGSSLGGSRHRCAILGP